MSFAVRYLAREVHFDGNIIWHSEPTIESIEESVNKKRKRDRGQITNVYLANPKGKRELTFQIHKGFFFVDLDCPFLKEGKIV
jgi:hypothetical protein